MVRAVFTCEGVTEAEAIRYFVDGYRDGTLLKHKLMRKNFQAMAEMIAIAEKYAVADSTMKKPIEVDAAGKVIQKAENKSAGNKDAGAQGKRPYEGRHDKRKNDNPDNRYGSKHHQQVNTVQVGNGAGSSRRQKGDRPGWQPEPNFESVLDHPCVFYSGTKKANQTTRACSFSQHLTRGEGIPPLPPLPAGGLPAVNQGYHNPAPASGAG